MPDSLRRLKVLHVILKIGATNGQYNEHCLPMRRQRNISICTYFAPELMPPPEIALYGGDNTLPGFYRALDAALAEQDPDVIHAHVPHTGVMLAMSRVLRTDILPRAAYTVQNSYQNYRPRNRMMHYPVFQAFPQVVFCSHASYDSFPAALRLLVRGKWSVASNAVDIGRIDRILATTERTRSGDRFVVVSVGRLIAIKNPVAIVQAFAQHAGESDRLVFVGDGDWRERVQTSSLELGLDGQVELTGLVPRDEVFRNVANADLFVSASRGEGLPVAVLEAMACGCPVVLSDIAPHRELSEGADFIPLLDPDDVAGFAQAINRFRAMSPAQRQATGQQCRQQVQQRYGLDAMHKKLDEVYRKLARTPFVLTSPKEQAA
jgi:glycosyltransferase involved in cell wall biosynthesis